ncbi:MAG: sugar phosphate nucleotidyltransferase [Bradymonadia bacterium]
MDAEDHTPLWRGAVLAAGLGSRLRPLTHHRPKPLVPIMGRPLVSFALDALARAGVDPIGINTWHLGAQIPHALAHRPERLHFVDEETLQGTGGGLRGIAACLEEVLGDSGPLVAVNSDALFSFDVSPVLAAHARHRPLATLALRQVPQGSPFARVAVDEDGLVWRISEVERRGAHPDGLRLGAFTGVQVVSPALVEAIPEGPGDVFRTAHKALMAEGVDVRGFFVDTEASCFWLDVGTPERYLDAHAAILTGAMPMGGLPEPDGRGRRVHPSAEISPRAEIEGPCWIGPKAQVHAGARIGALSAVGAEAEIASGVHLDRTVVWSGVRVGAGLWSQRVIVEDQLS